MSDADFASIVARLRAAGCVFAEEEAALLIEAVATGTELAELVQRRVGGFPLEYLLGWAEFCGLRISVAPGVFVPRRRTEFLVRQALELLSSSQGLADRSLDSAPVVLDLCCGSGAIAAAIAAVREDVELYATDLDSAAVNCARQNLAQYAPGAQVFQGDLFAALPTRLLGEIDVLMVNAPYVPTAEIALMPPEARLYEAPAALDGGQDGLRLQRRIAAEIRRWLRPGGRMLIETSLPQAALTAEIFAANGLSTRVASCQESGATVVHGTFAA
ncbi:putative protein N(5)-glutamine methyltransferase [Psychromicrobium sp. YIM B11713]|uniref:putative protein N(5)-glutamine methyltransferase n=1 Tax=Psychromicrobium sp. YIM B11713 TaxID=3145233 RepID=UPI00374E8198